MLEGSLSGAPFPEFPWFDFAQGEKRTPMCRKEKIFHDFLVSYEIGFQNDRVGRFPYD